MIRGGDAWTKDQSPIGVQVPFTLVGKPHGASSVSDTVILSDPTERIRIGLPPEIVPTTAPPVLRPLPRASHRTSSAFILSAATYRIRQVPLCFAGLISSQHCAMPQSPPQSAWKRSRASVGVINVTMAPRARTGSLTVVTFGAGLSARALARSPTA